MADSLRDQLIAAGYQAPKKEAPKKPSGKKSNNRNSKAGGKDAGSNHRGGKRPNTNRSQPTGAGARKNAPKPQAGKRSKPAQKNSDPEAIEARKKLKAQIKVLIDENKADAWKGEIVYRYLVDNRIRELYVTEEIHKKLADRELSVTRLNGDTFLVPREVALNIVKINPQWSVFNLELNEATAVAADDTDKEYAEFQVPDDLKW